MTNLIPINHSSVTMQSPATLLVLLLTNYIQSQLLYSSSPHPQHTKPLFSQLVVWLVAMYASNTLIIAALSHS